MLLQRPSLLIRSALLAGIAVHVVASPLAAQPVAERIPAIQPGDVIEFSAETMTYSDSDEVVTAAGAVRINRDKYTLNADEVIYNRTTGQVEAHGNVVSTDPAGNRAFGDRVLLTESLRDGAIDNILLVLKDGGRLAAKSGVRVDGLSILNRAVYSPCAVEGADGCPREPVWQIKAVKVVHDPIRHRISYRHAALELFGIPVLALPAFSHPDGGAARASGLLVPEVSYRAQLGVGIAAPYNIAFGPDRDLTIEPWLYSAVNPALELRGRQLFSQGPVQARAFMTYARLTEFAPNGVTEVERGNAFRGYFEANGRLQHSPEWRSTFAVRLTTDDTFNRRYGLDYDDTLRSTYNLERFRSDSYLSISGWFFQGLRLAVTPGNTPLALPLIDYRWDPAAPILGGHLTIAANSLNLYRSQGQDLRRVFSFVQWQRSLITPLGQRVMLTGLVRGDLYDTSDSALATLPAYAGTNGLRGRIIPAAAIDVVWPFAGPLYGGDQTITPRMQIVASPRGRNSGIPNEDSRAVDLEDVNLFSLNRFPGYDRWEGGSRLTYGIEYSYVRPRFSLRTQLGQSYRLDDSSSEFPTGTGLSGRLSDIVGRTTLKYGRFFELTHRFRLDKSSLLVRRNEFDIAVGTNRNYVTVAYVKLNRNIIVEDLRDLEEVRLGARVAFATYWSAFGSTIIDLTSRREEPASMSDGFSPVRHRIGVQYEDECFRFGIAWRRDYRSDRDFRAGSTYLLTLAFKNLGR